jgi:glycosyltransferase involved in cell wall biosynthesis
MDSSLISIIIPYFNRQKYLAATLQSCLDQTYRNLEIIAGDDGSTDDSLDIAKHYATLDDRVKIFHTVNQGPCIARNIGLGMAEGTYIKFLDSDDILLPYAIEYQAQALIHYQVDLSISQILNFWDQEFDQKRSQLPDRLTFSATDAVKKAPYFDFVKEGKITFNEILLKRELAEVSGGFEPWLGGANESSLNAKLLVNFPQAKAVFHSEAILLLKRIGYYSLAATNRMSKTTLPWALISHQKSAEYILKREGVDAAVRDLVFNRLYQLAIYAYRHGFRGYALNALAVWQQAGLASPLVHPWYHNLLHSSLGFERAEGLLSTSRTVISPIRNLKESMPKKAH